MTASFAIGIDLGGTNLKGAVVDRDGVIFAKHNMPTEACRGPDAVQADMVNLVDRLLAEIGQGRTTLSAVGIGSPGPLSPSKGIIFHCANLPGWNHVPLRREMAERLGCRVVVENDANAAAFGEYWMGCHRGQTAVSRSCDDLVLLTLGTGIGGGVILDGRVFHGHFENAAELGHMIVAPGGRRCPCGQAGCLERYASADAVARRVEEAVRAGMPSCLSANVLRGESIDARQAAQAVGEGDELCGRIWNEACRYLAIACVNIQHTFNPARIVLSGGLTKAGDRLFNPVRECFQALRWSLHDDYPIIVPSALGVDAGVIGAAALAMVGE